MEEFVKNQALLAGWVNVWQVQPGEGPAGRQQGTTWEDLGGPGRQQATKLPTGGQISLLTSSQKAK